MFGISDVFFALCSLLFALCSLLFALCSLLFALCSLLFALCSLLFALCHFLALPFSAPDSQHHIMRGLSQMHLIKIDQFQNMYGSSTKLIMFPFQTDPPPGFSSGSSWAGRPAEVCARGATHVSRRPATARPVRPAFKRGVGAGSSDKYV
jgi:hypothetical protein